jgi:ABC-2 type transport system ATP-binding protein
MIEAVDLTRTFGELIAVDHVTLSIRDGEAFAFLGPNGAGKTTTVRMLCCLIAPSGGNAYVGGKDIRNEADRLRIRQAIGFLPEAPGLYESLSAYANLEYFAKLYGVPAAERDKRLMELLKSLDLWDRRNDAVGKFSKGMKQKVAIARALVHDPEYLFLDEPTAGLDPQASVNFRNILIDLKKEGRTLFLNTHNLDEAQRVCERIGVLRSKLLAVGTPEELASKFFGRTTVVHLKAMSPDYTAAVRAVPGVLAVKALENALLVDLKDPDEQNPDIVQLLVSKGAQVEYVNELKHGLEDIYLKLVEGPQ